MLSCKTISIPAPRGDAKEAQRGEADHHDPSERSVSREGPYPPGRRGRQGIHPHRRHDRPLPVRPLGEQALLRRHRGEDGVPGAREGPLIPGAVEMVAAALASKRHRATDDADAIELCFARGWTDGLPVVPPTPERVDHMLGAVRMDP